MANERFSSVWDAIEDTPEQADNMRLRAELMGKIADRVAEWEVTQKVAAERLGITQPRLNDLLNGRISRFSLDALVNLSRPALGGHLHISLDKKNEGSSNDLILSKFLDLKPPRLGDFLLII